MGILDGKKKKFENIGNTGPRCPYCDVILDKMPTRKSQCPKCGKFYFVRTRPSDELKVLVTEEQVLLIEEQWAILNGTYDQLMAERQEFSRKKEDLRVKYGTEPSENDVRWSLLNKDLIEHARQGNWGFYRNTKFEMAELLRKELKFETALSTYLEICYLDCNGPMNTGGDGDLKRKPFLVADAFLAPGVISRVLSMIKKLECDKEEIKSIFFKIADINYKSLHLPVSPERAWNKISIGIFKE